jgi:hypothetical protein
LVLVSHRGLQDCKGIAYCKHYPKTVGRFFIGCIFSEAGK